MRLPSNSLQTYNLQQATELADNKYVEEVAYKKTENSVDTQHCLLSSKIKNEDNVKSWNSWKLFNCWKLILETRLNQSLATNRQSQKFYIAVKAINKKPSHVRKGVQFNKSKLIFSVKSSEQHPIVLAMVRHAILLALAGEVCARTRSAPRFKGLSSAGSAPNFVLKFFKL